MHFSIPETQEVIGEGSSSGASYVAYSIHINGTFHCLLRFKQLNNFHDQLRKEFGPNLLPPFPPKKIFPLNPQQLEDRRAQLEKYMQIISQNPRIAASNLFLGFLLHAQQETHGVRADQICIKLILSSEERVSCTIGITDKTSESLSKIADQMKIDPKFIPYFSLFIFHVGTSSTSSSSSNSSVFQSHESPSSSPSSSFSCPLSPSSSGESIDSCFTSRNNGSFLNGYVPNRVSTSSSSPSTPFLPALLTDQPSGAKPSFQLVRKLQDFESPILTLEALRKSFPGFKFHLTIRTSYWDTSYDEDLMQSPACLRILHHQTLNDLEQGFIPNRTRESRQQVSNLVAMNRQKEFIHLLKGFKFYSYIHFHEHVYCDYPSPNTVSIVSMGGSELLLRNSAETSFKVTRIRCWRLTTGIIPVDDGPETNRAVKQKDQEEATESRMQLELSFECLMSKDILRWITIHSPQAVLMSMFLQGMVNELLLKKQGFKVTPTQSSSTNSSSSSIPNTQSSLRPDALTRSTPSTRPSSWSFMSRDGSLKEVPLQTEQPVAPVQQQHLHLGFGGDQVDSRTSFSGKRILNTNHMNGVVKYNNRKPIIENEAFHGIKEEDL